MMLRECTHFKKDGKTRCDNCRVEKKLQILNGCKVLAESDIETAVKVWQLAPRTGASKKGEQNTQIELTECTWKLVTTKTP